MGMVLLSQYKAQLYHYICVHARSALSMIFLHTQSAPNVDRALDLNNAAASLDLCGTDPNLTNQYRNPRSIHFYFVRCPQILNLPLIIFFFF